MTREELAELDNSENRMKLIYMAQELADTKAEAAMWKAIATAMLKVEKTT
jgi:hypothetical protein